MSETVKVVYYTSKTLKNGSHPLMLRVSKDGKKKFQSLGIENNKYYNSFILIAMGDTVGPS